MQIFRFQLQLQVRYSTRVSLDHSITELSKPDSLDGFWELSEQIFNRISDKSDHVNYLFGNRDVAMFV